MFTSIYIYIYIYNTYAHSPYTSRTYMICVDCVYRLYPLTNAPCVDEYQMCMSVCMYACMHACMHACISACMY